MPCDGGRYFHGPLEATLKWRLWISIHNMEVGCGIEVRVVKGRRYLYLWSYRRENGHSKRIWKYLGPARESETKKKALQALAADYAVARGEMTRRLAIARSKLAGL